MTRVRAVKVALKNHNRAHEIGCLDFIAVLLDLSLKKSNVTSFILLFTILIFMTLFQYDFSNFVPTFSIVNV